jgi:two-component system, chemotaxis family, sensor kinase CheA
MNPQQLAERLLATFVSELEEGVRAMNRDLLVLEQAPDDAERLKSLFRVAHSLKGVARAAAVQPIAEACHQLESLLAEARDGQRMLGAPEFALLFGAADGLAEAGRRLKGGETLGVVPFEIVSRRVPRRPRAAAKADSRETSARPIGPERREGQVRVQAEKLDALLAISGQLRIAAGRADGHPAEWDGVHLAAHLHLGAFRRAGRKVRVAMERAGLPAVLSQSVNALERELEQLVRTLGRLAAAARADTALLNEVVNEVGEGVRQLRMRPFAEACEALPRVTRDVAMAVGKEAQFSLVGGEIEADRAVLEGLEEALIQLVRNAVDHGTEPAAARVKAGKPRAGTVTVKAEPAGERMLVTVADDGAGLNVAGIRERAKHRGLPVPADDRELVATVFSGGLSTSREVSAISGRGVGLDVVRAAVERIRGRVQVAWEAGRGTTFTIECAPSLATTHCLLVEAGGRTMAIPVAHVERVARLRVDGLRQVEGRVMWPVADGPVPVVSLARLLPPLAQRPMEGTARVVVLRVGDQRLAAVVDELVTERQLMVRPVGQGRAALPLLAGAAILESGSVALVLDAPALLEAAGATGAGVLPGTTVGTPAARRRCVLVVDDSITTRTLEQSILEAAGYDVLTAVDGADGWRLLHDRGCDLVVADIEMPRMDGFQLCEAIRSSRRFEKLPVVLVTALETAEHRARGLEVGADGYIAKSSFDQQNLLETIEQLLG